MMENICIMKRKDKLAEYALLLNPNSVECNKDKQERGIKT